MTLACGGKTADHRTAMSRIPTVVVEAFKKWNAGGLKGMGTFRGTERQRGGPRLYGVTISVTQITFYSAQFEVDGSRVAEFGGPTSTPPGKTTR